MAKKVQTTQLKGFLTVDNMEIEETIKDVPYVYDLLEVLRSYDEKTVTISIKEEEDLQPKED